MERSKRQKVENRYAHLTSTLGIELFEKVQQSRILVVGAGGIGCELLKNLVLSGFKNIEIIDLDTIDLSNLNRQFLFQRQHIGKSKAQVARESALRFNPDVNIIAHHGNIKNHEFGPDFFKKFTIVMNALDNLDARRHVNRLCIATERPLIESGTAGYHGQVQVIVKGVTECYECSPKPAPKTYAYCTIRSNPKEPIHCVIWGKEEFRTHFGDAEAVASEEEEPTEDSEILKQEMELELKKNKSFEEWLFHKLFFTDIFRKVRVAALTNKNIWPEKKEAPRPLRLEDTLMINTGSSQNLITEHTLPDQIVWNVKQNAEQFMLSAKKLKARSANSPIEFDKDDSDALDFVTSASNLRSYIFSIPLQSRFAVKSLAGNIIPAIATTNAIIAGLIVMEALKLLRSRVQDCRMTYLQKVPSGGRLLIASEHEKQNPACYVCCSNFLTVKVNTKTSLGALVDKVLKASLGMNEPSVIVNNNILYESGEDLEDEEKENMERQRKKCLLDVGIVHNTIIDVDDNSQNFNLKISVLHTDVFPEEDQFFEIVGRAPVAPTRTERKDTVNIPKDIPSLPEDDVMIVETVQSVTSNRKRKNVGEEDREPKKQKAGVIEL